MEGNGLVDLLHIQVHRTDAPTVTNVIHKFAQTSARRIKFTIQSHYNFTSHSTGVQFMEKEYLRYVF